MYIHIHIYIYINIYIHINMYIHESDFVFSLLKKRELRASPWVSNDDERFSRAADRQVASIAPWIWSNVAGVVGLLRGYLHWYHPHWMTMMTRRRSVKILWFQASTCWLRRGGPAWNKVDWDDMSSVSAAVCCSCRHGVDFTCVFPYKIWMFKRKLQYHSFRCNWSLNVLTLSKLESFSPNLAEKINNHL